MILCNRSKIICRPDLGGGMFHRFRKGLMERYRMRTNNDNPVKVAPEDRDIHQELTTFCSHLKDEIGWRESTLTSIPHSSADETSDSK